MEQNFNATFATAPKANAPAFDKKLSYNDAVAKGQKSLNMMRADDHAAGKMLNPPQVSAASRFLDQASLQNWGYTRIVDLVDSGFALRPTNFAKFLHTVGLYLEAKTNEGNAIWVEDFHLNSITHMEKLYPSTAARFVSFIDRPHGLLVASCNHNPAWCAAETGTLSSIALPKLQHWSDIAYLQWTDPSLQSLPNDLKYVVRLSIVNEDTIAVIQRIGDDFYEANGRSIWLYVEANGGITWDVETEEAKALLGTPNGSGVAWLLAQHKRELGHKVVESVTLFWNDTYERPEITYYPSLLFQIRDCVGKGIEIVTEKTSTVAEEVRGSDTH